MYIMPTVTDNDNNNRCNDYDDIHNKSWNDMTEEEQELVMENISNSKLYIEHKIQCDSTIDGYLMRKVLLKPQLQSSIEDSTTISNDGDSLHQYNYSVPTSNRFKLLDELEAEVNRQYVSIEQETNLMNKDRSTNSRISHSNQRRVNTPKKEWKDKTRKSTASPLQKKNNHIAACKRLENKIYNMPFKELVDYCTSRVLTPTVKNLVKINHSYLFDVNWIHDSRSPGAYLAYICASNHRLSKADALGYCLELN